MNNYYSPNYYNPYSYSQPQTQQIVPPAQTNNLNGKIVDSVEMAKASDVPIGGYCIFPKADLSEIYIKKWNNNGTTDIITYAVTKENLEEEKNEIDLSQLLERVDSIENKIDNLISTSVSPKKTEVKLNEY